jgi:NitT/TauT family transport system ATP-binding protein
VNGQTSVIAIEVRHAGKVYANGVRALEPVRLSVRAGEFVTVIGPSGCGKSTLLRMVAGLTAPSLGSIALWPAAHTLGAQRPDELAFVFQHPTLMAWASVEQNVRLPLQLAHAGRADADAKVSHALALVRLEEFRNAYPRELSGGMQMRTSIARALVTQPRLLLMDEPFGALDEITRSRLDQDLLSLWAEEALTVLFVTHSIYEAVYLSTRVLVMSERPGQIFAEVVVGEPYPRSEAFRGSERFAHYCARLNEYLARAAHASPSDGSAAA